MHIWGPKHTLHMLNPGLVQHITVPTTKQNPVPLQYRQEHWFHLQSGLRFFTLFASAHGAFIFNSTSWAMGQQLPVDVILSSSTILPPSFLLSLLTVPCTVKDKKIPLPVFLHLWAVNEKCNGAPLVDGASSIICSFLQKQLAEEEARQCFICMLFCFSCFDEIHL